MEVAIAGAHGQIARRLARLLSQQGDTVRGLVRNADHTADVESDGARPVVCDLEHADADEIARAIEGAEAVVFAAGAGPGSGAERKATMDRDGAVKLLEAAQSAGVERYVIVSSIGAENPPEASDDEDDVFAAYLRAKAAADQAVMASDRSWTVIRPGRLTDEEGTGQVRIDRAPFRNEVTRDDVAAVLAAVLGEPRSAGAVLYVGAGNEPVHAALESALG